MNVDELVECQEEGEEALCGFALSSKDLHMYFILPEELEFRCQLSWDCCRPQETDWFIIVWGTKGIVFLTNIIVKHLCFQHHILENFSIYTNSLWSYFDRMRLVITKSILRQIIIGNSLWRNWLKPHYIMHHINYSSIPIVYLWIGCCIKVFLYALGSVCTSDQKKKRKRHHIQDITICDQW